MLLVDSSVWIDFFRNRATAQVSALEDLLRNGQELICIADLVLFEILRGIPDERVHEEVRNRLTMLHVVEIGGEENSVEGARLYRRLRNMGHTIASAVDVLQASFCIRNNTILLHSDQDFDAFEQYFGLQVWRT